MAARDILAQIIKCDEQIAKLKDEFEQINQTERVKLLVENYRQILSGLSDSDPLPVGLVRIAEMMLNLDDKQILTTLSDGLGHENGDIRLLSGDALLHLAEEGIENIMPAVDRALEKGGLQAEEMPFMLVDVNHPEVPRVLERFLKVKNPEIVASAIEALAEFGDPSSCDALGKLLNDKRTVAAEGDEANGGNWTIAQLAQDAIDLLSEEERDET